MSNSETRPEENKNSNGENSNSTIQSDTCLFSLLDSNTKQNKNAKKNKFSKQTASFSVGSSSKKPVKTGKKSKFVNKVLNRSKNIEKSFENEDLTAAINAISISSDNSEDNLCKPDWLRARDSLENLLFIRKDKQNTGNVNNSRSGPLYSQERSKLQEISPLSESTLTSKAPGEKSITKVLNWDPWDKLGRKNKRDNKRKKDKQTVQNSEMSKSPEVETNFKDHTSGDEIRNGESEEFTDSYEYKPYHLTRNSKSVEFTNEVKVVYFTGDEVVREAKEPLKKELEQQIRNKEMRKGHCPAMLFSSFKRRQQGDDYMAAWFKK